jgi:AraC-like DNA-binding protein
VQCGIAGLGEAVMDFSNLTELLLAYNNNQTRQMPNLLLYSRESEGKIEASVYDPVLCLVLQGQKTVSTRERTVELSRGDALVVSHATPVISQITQASREVPYLALIMTLDIPLIQDLHGQITKVADRGGETSSLSVGPAEAAWVEPISRYAQLAAQPMDAQILGPTTFREIHYRLLLSQAGQSLTNFLKKDSQAERVAIAIKHLRTDYRGPIKVNTLAKEVGMSASSFHEHFKAVTGTSPLQYQKDLRLVEAHILLTTANYNVGKAAFAVGYESASQFSRDYSKKFGTPPKTVAMRSAGVQSAFRQ